MSALLLSLRRGLFRVTAIVLPLIAGSGVGRADQDATNLVTVTVPYGVTTIDQFTISSSERENVTKIIIPETVTTIEDFAFHTCVRLMDITIPEGLTDIGSFVFADCASISEITLPSSLRSLGKFSFSGCASLTNIDVSSANPYFRSEAGVLFNKEGSRLVAYAPGKFGPFAIPDSVTTVAESAFSSSSNLTAVTIPDGVRIIEVGAFGGCTALSSVYLPNTVTTIGDFAFYSCTGLTNVILSDGLTTLSVGVFEYCPALQNVIIPDNVVAVENQAFANCYSLASATLGRNVASLGFSSFGYCTNLTAFLVHPLNLSYQSIDGVLFDASHSELLRYPPGRDGHYAIPSGVAAIGRQAFMNCIRLRAISIPDTVTDIRYSAFESCRGLTNLVIPDSVNRIQPDAFDDCQAIISVNFGNGLSEIAESTFSECSSLREVTISRSVTNIGLGAFSACHNLMAITIPTNVTSIERFAFSLCSRLTSVFFEGEPPIDGGNIFYETFATAFYRPQNSGWSTTYSGRPTAIWNPRSTYQEWVVSAGLNTQFPEASDAEDDPDDDGVSNYDEWFGGSDPTERASRLELEFIPRLADLSEMDQAPIGEEEQAIYFRSVPGRYYGVLEADALTGEWMLHAVRVASSLQTRFTFPKPSNAAFFRVVVLP